MISKSSGQIKGCITDCTGVPDGNYPSCISCEVYAACSGGRIIDNMPCPAGLKWNDQLKRCDYMSACDDNPCASSCIGKTNGNYQSCRSCDTYISCSNGYMYEMPCPVGLVWDDNDKRCEWTSTTCTNI